MDNFFNDFNKEQLNAITCDDSYHKICIYAGPGTGKTKALVGRYVYLVKEKHISPDDILCITFTKKAAKEMLDRISSVIDTANVKNISTIHSFCYKLLSKRTKDDLNINNFTILDENDQKSLIFQISNELKLENVFGDALKEIIDYIALSKSSFDYVNYLNKSKNIHDDIEKLNLQISSFTTDQELVKKLIFLKYVEKQIINNYLDFEDLIDLTLYQLKNNEPLRNLYTNRFIHVLVDEFQDLTPKEYEIIKILTSKHKNVFGVGDPDQSIYGFRGSDVDIFNKFYKSADVTFDFVTNYRSNQAILNLAHDLISKDKDRVKDIKLVANKKDDKNPLIIRTSSKDIEANNLVNKIKEILVNDKSIKRSDIAVLYRTNKSSLIIEQYLRLNNIPYKVYQKQDFFSSSEVKLVISYLKFFAKHDDISFFNIYNKPTRYISNAMINKLKQFANYKSWSIFKTMNYFKDDPFFKHTLDSFLNLKVNVNINEDFKAWSIVTLATSGCLDYILKSKDEDKINNVSQFLDILINFKPEDPSNIIDEFFNYIELLADSDIKTEKDKVQLMSIHCSKGLEFKYVFLIDFNEGLIPSAKATTLKSLKEERRILYVALTRAKDKLYIYDMNKDNIKGIGSISSYYNDFNKSSFKEEIDNSEPSDSYNLLSLKSNDNVINKFYGKGVIESIDSFKNTAKVKFNDYYYPKDIEIDNIIKIESNRSIDRFKLDDNVLRFFDYKKNYHAISNIGRSVYIEPIGIGYIIYQKSEDLYLTYISNSNSYTENIVLINSIKNNIYDIETYKEAELAYQESLNNEIKDGKNNDQYEEVDPNNDWYISRLKNHDNEEHKKDINMNNENNVNNEDRINLFMNIYAKNHQNNEELQQLLKDSYKVDLDLSYEENIKNLIKEIYVKPDIIIGLLSIKSFYHIKNCLEQTNDPIIQINIDLIQDDYTVLLTLDMLDVDTFMIKPNWVNVLIHVLTNMNHNDYLTINATTIIKGLLDIYGIIEEEDLISIINENYLEYFDNKKIDSTKSFYNNSTLIQRFYILNENDTYESIYIVELENLEHGQYLIERFKYSYDLDYKIFTDQEVICFEGSSIFSTTYLNHSPQLAIKFAAKWMSMNLKNEPSKLEGMEKELFDSLDKGMPKWQLKGHSFDEFE